MLIIFKRKVCKANVTFRWKRQIRIERLSKATINDIITARRLLLNFIFFLLIASFVSVFRLSLNFLHFCSLILEPNLNDSDGEPRILGECFSDFTARLWWHVKRRFKLTALWRCKDCARAFRPTSPISRSDVLFYDVVVVKRLRQVRLFLEIHSTNQLTATKRKLLAFLQRLTAVKANKAADVINEAVLYSHHKLVWVDLLAASTTFCAVDSIPRREKLHGTRRLSNFIVHLPIVVVFAIKLRVSNKALVVQKEMTNVAGETRFMPICISHAKVIAVMNFLWTSFANFESFLAFYGRCDVCKMEMKCEIKNNSRQHAKIDR